MFRSVRSWGIAIACLATICTGSAAADPTANQPSELGKAIDRGTAFLAKDAVAWKELHKCASCHHAALVVWSLNEAKRQSHAVDAAVLADMTRWLAEAGEGKTSVARPEGRPKALNTKAVYFALGLLSAPQPSDSVKEALARFRKTMHEDQSEDGSWVAWPETRPPMFGPSDAAMTALAAIALDPAHAESRPAVERAAQWLADRKSPSEQQDAALRLILVTRLGGRDAEAAALADWLVEHQGKDGGWQQTPEMASDAYATGQTLYALALADSNKHRDAIRRGQEFLIKTQADDGSWPMTSRPAKPGDAGAKNLVPIKGAAAAWAVIGLARSESHADQPAK
jgi:hypothetical protein